MRTAILALALVASAGTIVRSGNAPGPGPVPTPEVEAAVRAAIVEAVQDRLGPAAEVTVEHVWMAGLTAPASGITASIEPGARLGRPVHVRLMSASGGTGDVARFASVIASVSVRVEHTRLLAAIRAGSALTPDQTTSVVDHVAGVRLERLPTAAEVSGARARQSLPAGAVIEEWMIERDPVVRSGDVVGVLARVGGVEARGMAKASERGALGAVINLVNLQSGRRLKGRVIGRGEVEVVP
jgi:flagellar basal body P-ring formation protein FlgA